MHRDTGFQETLPNFFPRGNAGATARKAASRTWPAPTFGQFVRRLEHEFGDSVDLSTLHLTRLDQNETLTPESVRTLCEQLGVPPEDFGI